MPAPSNKVPLSSRRPAAPRQKSTNTPALKLPSDLPPVGKYHPLNFYSPGGAASSSHSSIPVTPQNTSPMSGGGSSYLQPLSPRSHTRTFSEAERRLHDYYRDRAVAASRSLFTPAVPSEKPMTPSLIPAISPGVVTPLELENAASYFGLAKGPSVPTSPAHSRSRSGDSSRGCYMFNSPGSMSPRTPPPAIDSF